MSLALDTTVYKAEGRGTEATTMKLGTVCARVYWAEGQL